MAISGSDAREYLVEVIAEAMRLANAWQDLKDFAAATASKYAFLGAAEMLGLELEDDEVTIDSIGRALGAKVEEESGLQIGNIFDGEALPNKFERAGIALLLDRAGVDLPATRKSLGDAVGILVRRRLEGDIAAFAGSVPVNQSMVDMVLKSLERQNRELLDTPEAISNRERQERYRAGHRRVVAG